MGFSCRAFFLPCAGQHAERREAQPSAAHGDGKVTSNTMSTLVLIVTRACSMRGSTKNPWTRQALCWFHRVMQGINEGIPCQDIIRAIFLSSSDSHLITAGHDYREFVRQQVRLKKERVERKKVNRIAASCSNSYSS